MDETKLDAVDPLRQPVGQDRVEAAPNAGHKAFLSDPGRLGDAVTSAINAALAAADRVQAVRKESLHTDFPPPSRIPKMPDDTRPATVRVRALVIVDPDGKWTVTGDGQNPEDKVREWSYDGAGDLGRSPWAEYWIEADVPLPVARPDENIEAEVVSDA